jgi:catechol 2,3-dioxygenase-like lactoylglutathione lyase family enzyme
MNGGGGMEIWQYTSRKPVAANFEVLYGDLGIYACKIKSRDIAATYAYLQKNDVQLHGGISKNPAGEEHFFFRDLYGNIFEVVPSVDWFAKTKYTTGGPYGAILGVSDIEKSLTLYRDVLGYDTIIYDVNGVFDDVKVLQGGEVKQRRVLLTHSEKRIGPFSKLLGTSVIELVQIDERKPRKIFENRYWGDLGFIHLCFDIQGMHEMEALCRSKGFPFTVDSAKSFDMGEAAGHFTYIEDPDGTLIEFVETHKIPILKKMGWYLNLRKRSPGENLPDWMLKALALNRKRD